MNTEAATTSQTADAHGGFRLTRFSQMLQGLAFSGVLTLDGRKVGTARQDGNGGITNLQFEDRDARDRFETVAAQTYPDALEPGEEFINRLADVADLNRRRNWLVQLDDERDFFTIAAGEAYVVDFSAKVPRERLVAHLRGTGFDGRHARLWDRTRGQFVAVADLDA